MPTLLSRRAVLLMRIETTEGVEAVPGFSLALLPETPLRITFNPNIIDTTEVNPSLDPFDPIVGGMSATVEFDLYIKGSGSPVVPPEFGVPLKACGFLETTQNTAIGPEACVGGSTTSAVLGALAGTTEQQYRGLPIMFTGAVSLTTTIWNYSGATKTALLTDTASAAIGPGTTYTIIQNVTYAPTSINVPSATIYIYIDGLLYKFIGCRGTCPLTLTSGGPGRLSFRFMGQLTTKTDTAMITPFLDSTRPPIWKGGSFTINSQVAAAQTMTIDPGNNLVLPDNPNATEGFDPAIITSRNIRGSINPKELLIATRDIMGAFRSQTKQPIQARMGTVAGNSFAITVPSALYLNQTPGDRNGYQAVDVPFHATGLDSGYSITMF